MASRFFTVLCAFAIGGSACAAALQPAAQTPAANAGEPTDVTKSFRRPGELVAACGAITVKDLGKWPDMQAAMEGKGPLYVNRALQGAVNARGEVVSSCSMRRCPTV